MRMIAVVNQKGGVGKTTTAVNLSAALAEKGRKVLLIDLDAQQSASLWYGIRNAEKGIYAAFVENGNLTDLFHETEAGVDVIPSSPYLVRIEHDLSRKVAPQVILKKKLEQLPAGRWNYVILDCPPTLGILTVNALAAVREVIVPVEASYLALTGFAQLLEIVDEVKEGLNPGLEVTGIIPCRVDLRTRNSQEALDLLNGKFGNIVYNTRIRNNVRINESPSWGQPITQYDTKSAGAADYRALADEVIAQEKAQ